MKLYFNDVFNCVFPQEKLTELQEARRSLQQTLLQCEQQLLQNIENTCWDFRRGKVLTSIKDGEEK